MYGTLGIKYQWWTCLYRWPRKWQNSMQCKYLLLIKASIFVRKKYFSDERELLIHWIFWIVLSIVIKRVMMCKDMTTRLTYMGCYHTITNHTMYVHRGTTSTVYFISKSKTNKIGLTIQVKGYIFPEKNSVTRDNVPEIISHFSSEYNSDFKLLHMCMLAEYNICWLISLWLNINKYPFLQILISTSNCNLTYYFHIFPFNGNIRTELLNVVQMIMKLRITPKVVLLNGTYIDRCTWNGI